MCVYVCMCVILHFKKNVVLPHVHNNKTMAANHMITA